MPAGSGYSRMEKRDETAFAVPPSQLLQPQGDIMPSDAISILLVEDNQITRAGLRLTLQQSGRFRLVGEAATGRAGVMLALEVKPEVVLMDIGLPDIDGIEATWQIKTALPSARVVILTSHEKDEDVLAALGVGADGYCYKDVSIEDLTSAIEAVHSGASWLDPRIASRINEIHSGAGQERSHVFGNNKPAASAQARNSGDGRKQPLSNDARPLGQTIPQKILNLWRQGLSAQAIASQLAVSDDLVRLHLRVLEEKQCRPAALGVAVAARGGSLAQELDQDTDIFEPGSMFAERYMIESLVAEGGMGRLYKARHRHMDRVVAVKVLAPEVVSDRRVIKRFEEESKAASTLNHRNIVTVFDFGVTRAGQPFLIMDYIDGPTLEEIIRQEPKPTLKEALKILFQLCDGLSTAHNHGVVHCDLKPSNIMLPITKDDRSALVKIVDFGLARVLPLDGNKQVQLTDTFEISGSPTYMSPEQCRGGKMDPRSDIYSLGCVMYELLSGGIPAFEGITPMEIFARHFCSPPSRFADVCPERAVPLSLEEVVFKALAKEPEQRYQSVDDLRLDLQRAYCGLEYSVSAPN